MYLLELMITTPSQSICEPLGLYSTEEKARHYAKQVKKRFPAAKGANVEVEIILMEPDERPPILDIEIDATAKLAQELVYFYDMGILDQVVEPDGNFSYVVAPKFKRLLERGLSEPRE